MCIRDRIGAESPLLDVFFVTEQGGSALAAVYTLRNAGFSADSDHAGRSLKGQLTYGQKHARATLVMGDEGWMLRRTGELDVSVDGIDHLQELL